MEQEKIAQLKELKDLVDQGILSEEEFMIEKQKVLSKDSQVTSVTLSDKPNGLVTSSQQDVQIISSPNNQECEFESIEIEPIPLSVRYIFTQTSSREDAYNLIKRKITVQKVSAIIGVILIIVFVVKCYVGGFWSILFAVFWALLPGCIFPLTYLNLKDTYSSVEKRLEKMSSAEYFLHKKYIREKRTGAIRAVGEFAKAAGESYAEQTGGRNLFFDIGQTLGGKIIK